jgi:hypothetical protein
MWKLVFLVHAALGLSACQQQSQPRDCTQKDVVLDAGTDALPPAGQYATGAVCERLCGSDFSVCTRQTARELHCQFACE